MEVFQVTKTPSRAAVARPKVEQSQYRITTSKLVIRFTNVINNAITARRESLLQAELEVARLEDSSKDEQSFVGTFAQVAMQKML